MTITVGGITLPLTYPLDDNESFLDSFLKMFDGQATPVGATLAVPTGLVFGTYQWNATAGSVATLPAATGSLMTARFVVSVLATSNSHILYCAGANGGSGTDVFQGIVLGFNNSTGAPLAFAAASTSNTITLNRTTTGSVTKGETITVTDVASGVWAVTGWLSASGADFVTPFSHT